ncbi:MULTISPECIES: hypothetical protein [unclassified Lentimicrobium]|uniref:hypothetical protein n=1 Tax=unclassified Lentimicrobium TaxID=2677434 RepID=UPI001555ECB1|nr:MULTISPECIES: hypothetical protein [unclassified Lentimicrobium]NPD45095.1 hypothetical protein [Lentimicrobium sp. S6]NPD85388.1 hypothetical protein [Lentimicrobium sp. L6]
MRFNLMKEELAAMLASLTEQFELMDSHKENIPQIEMDIFIRNIQKLYEDTIYLKKLNESPVLKTEKEQEVQEYKLQVEESKAVLVKEPVKEEAMEEPKYEEVLKEEISMSEEVIEEVQEEIVEIDFKVEVEEKIPEEQVEEVKSSLDDMIEQPNLENNLFSQVKTSPEISDLNKKLADARNTHSIVEKLQNNRIENLKSVIGINDKFYFINELFGGNAQKYEDIIYTLNNFKKLEDAMQYFSTLKYRFNWDEESEPFAKLVNMLERKFNLIDA